MLSAIVRKALDFSEGSESVSHPNAGLVSAVKLLAAAATGTAALLGPLRERLEGKRGGIVLCGANIDLKSFQTFVTRRQRLVGRTKLARWVARG